jgi:hypothetical protein
MICTAAKKQNEKLGNYQILESTENKEGHEPTA